MNKPVLLLMDDNPEGPVAFERLLRGRYASDYRVVGEHLPERGSALGPPERAPEAAGSPNSTLGDGRAEQRRARPLRGDQGGADDAIGEGFLLLDLVARLEAPARPGEQQRPAAKIGAHELPIGPAV